MEKRNSIPASRIAACPSADEREASRLLAEELRENPAKIVVLDDDPTGVQTVHGVSVYTDWSAESIREGFLEESSLFYILTNSRGMTAEETANVHRDIANRVCAVSRETNIPYLLMSRSDSTMRGHYPLETETLKETLEANGEPPFDGEILCFFFQEGGRYTIENVHYVKEGDALIPAGETEFAKDRSFGYRSSDLTEYVEEKTGGAYRAADVAAVTLAQLRALDVDGIERQLLELKNFRKLVVNATCYSDLNVFCAALYRAIRKGKRFLFRTAAALVKAAGGIGDRPLLSREELLDAGNKNGGIILAGSHVNRTTRQLEALRDAQNVEFVEFDQHLAEYPDALRGEALRVTAAAERIIREGKTAVVHTRREKYDPPADDAEAQLLVSVQISDAVTSVIGKLTVRPSFIVAKGGITSSDVGTKALRVRRALVMGQILPGVPVWKTGEESKFPGLPYIIFPGNVGEDGALLEILSRLGREDT